MPDMEIISMIPPTSMMAPCIVWRKFFQFSPDQFRVAAGIDHDAFPRCGIVDDIRKILVETADGKLSDFKHSDSPANIRLNICGGNPQESVRTGF